MPKLNITFEPLPSPVPQVLKDWEEAIKNTDQSTYTFPTVDEVPEDIKPLVQKIRSELEARGIDPSTVYPSGIENNKGGPFDLTVTLSYVNFEKTNG